MSWKKENNVITRKGQKWPQNIFCSNLEWQSILNGKLDNIDIISDDQITHGEGIMVVKRDKMKQAVKYFILMNKMSYGFACIMRKNLKKNNRRGSNWVLIQNTLTMYKDTILWIIAQNIIRFILSKCLPILLTQILWNESFIWFDCKLYGKILLWTAFP